MLFKLINVVVIHVYILQSSFARYMSGQGFDTWILEVRGAGLSVRGSNLKEVEQSAYAVFEQMEAVAEGTTDETVRKIAVDGVNSVEQQRTEVLDTLTNSRISSAEEKATGLAVVWDESQLVTKLTETFMRLSESLSGFLNESQSKIMSAKLFDRISKLLEDSQFSGRFNEIRVKLSSLLETRQSSGIASQIRELSERLVNTIEEGQRSVSPQLFDLQERLFSTIDDFQKQLDLIVKYDWDFDHYLEEDVPAAVR